MKRVLLLIALAACSQPETDSASMPQPDSGAPPEVVGVVPDIDLRPHAANVLAFLRGQGQLDTALVADSITLHVTPEGGNAQRRLSRAEAMQREAWQVADFTLIPPAELTVDTIRPSVHFNCNATTLAQRFPPLADSAHVGVLLTRPDRSSCLQTWNVTFVFSSDPAKPRLIAAVYDQWEW